MIKKLIDRLLGKKAATAGGAGRPAAATAPAGPVEPPVVPGVRVEIPAADHGIDPALVDERAIKVVDTLVAAGHQAYIVGGAVRDLAVGLKPKDFDVATDATPEQVKALFRRAFIIGRRFRIVHVVFGRGRDHEVIEVSTFRALVDPAAGDPVQGNERTAKGELADRHHAVGADGRILRDNVWGPQHEDAARRDFTVNAMYYDPRRQVVVDYHGGLRDARARVLRMIGDPATRYREDPVRIIRVVRFAAKLGFDIDPATRAPMKAMAGLLDNVPQSRLFDEMVKLLQTGHALASVEELHKQGLHRGVFPVLDVVLDEAHRHDGREAFVKQALADTDRRVAEGKPVAPSYLLACMLWHEVLKRWEQLQSSGEPPFMALQQAVDEVFDARIGDISGRGKLATDMREIWLMQPRFERRTGSAPFSLIEQPRFRAGFDFLRLRADCGEVDPGLAAWWEAFSTADEAGRLQLIEQVKPAGARKAAGGRRRVVAPKAPAGEAEAAVDSVGRAPREAAATVDIDLGEARVADAPAGAVHEDEDDAAPLADAPAKRRRRRRRRPAGGTADTEGTGAGTPTAVRGDGG
jgi:poly(A) polymerase